MKITPMMKSIYSLFRKTKLMPKLLLSYLLLIIVPLGLLAILSYRTISNALTDKTAYSAKQSFEQSYSYLSYKLHNILNQTVQIAENRDLRTIISRDPSEYINDQLLLVKETKALTTYLQEKEEPNNIKRIRLYINDNLSLSANKLNIFSINNITDSTWHQKLSEDKNRNLWIPSSYLKGDETNLSSTDPFSEDTLSLGMKVVHPMDYTDIVGYIRCDFSKPGIVSILSNANSISNSISYIVNSQNAVVAYSSSNWDDRYLIDVSQVSHEQAEWETKPIAGETALVGCRTIADTDWCMVTIIPYGQITYESRRIFHYLLILMLGIVTVAYITAFLISRSITKRVSKLAEKMNDLRDGKLSPIAPSEVRDEIGMLIDDYNYMTERMSELIEAQYKSGQELKSAELKALQAQINPHFLYNTLDMINWYGRKSNSPEILSIVNSLTKFYRLSLSRGQETISIQDELEHVRNYFTIQNLRFESKLELFIDVPDNILPYQILKITLQPLVENSILHGIMCKESKSGRIIISGKIENEIIILSVRDDGIGMTQDKIEEILDGTSPNKKRNFGVRNVNDRIKVYYGQEFGLSYDSVEGEGTTVYIRFPAR